MYGQTPLLRRARRGAAAAKPDTFVERNIISHDRADGSCFADAGNYKISRMKRRHGFVGFDIAEVMQTYYVLFRPCIVNDGLGPDSVLVEAPSH